MLSDDRLDPRHTGTRGIDYLDPFALKNFTFLRRNPVSTYYNRPTGNLFKGSGFANSPGSKEFQSLRIVNQWPVRDYGQRRSSPLEIEHHINGSAHAHAEARRVCQANLHTTVLLSQLIQLRRKDAQ
jgi:hypothetical protein